MDYAEALDRGIDGGDPDFGCDAPPAHYPECDECEHVWHPSGIQIVDGRAVCEDCR